MVERYNCPPMSDQKPEPDGCMVYASDYDKLAESLEKYQACRVHDVNEKEWLRDRVNALTAELREAERMENQAHERVAELEAALLAMVNAWEPDGDGSDRRLWLHAKDVLQK